MSKRFAAVALLLVSLSTPLLAAPRRDDGDQSTRSSITKFIRRVLHALDYYDLSWPKP